MSVELEAASGARFRFGENWSRFLRVLDDSRIAAAEASLRDMLSVADLADRTFLDVGCGSGLFSLAARRLGARVRTFDYDALSVACATELRRRYFPNDPHWQIDQGSVLDAAYMRSLGEFDVVYSWGVLHHTGAMWVALEHAIGRVAAGGRLFIAIYADQGWKSRIWWFLKLFYNRLPRPLRPAYELSVSGLVRAVVVLKHLVRLRPKTAIAPLIGDASARGMSAKHDRVDWIGGFPYEFASLDTLVAYLQSRGFVIQNCRPARSLGCHELVAVRAVCAG